ncbi:DinB family protein [Mucisphaera calidilacus]|uniref:DinB superfamily protein n=1 Tax=Mucisphaera calidilacus TaxID=2527982 RepID=A0A518BXN4_9BACT|nr:DinB family protein [Mucisphaera calidilacus]QDU71735.1 DinB superfamily protein [Mucisphaera calidilacus]
MRELLSSYRMNQSMIKAFLGDLPAERMAEMPGGVNPPAWIIGHLCIAGDGMLKLLGQSPVCPASYEKLFDMKSTPTDDLAAYPSKDELVATYEKIATMVTVVMESVTDETLNAENPMEGLRQPLPTIGDMLSFMMTVHEAMHVGQLSAWRRASGYKPLF